MCNGVSIGSPPTQRVRPGNVIAGTSDVRAAPEIAEIGAIRDPSMKGIPLTSNRASDLVWDHTTVSSRDAQFRNLHGTSAAIDR